MYRSNNMFKFKIQFWAEQVNDFFKYVGLGYSSCDSMHAKTILIINKGISIFSKLYVNSMIAVILLIFVPKFDIWR